MKKFICVIILIIVVFCISVFIGKKLFNVYEENDENTNTIVEENENKNESESTNIKERGSMLTSGILGPEDGISYDNLIGEMVWNSESALYHKIITNVEEYNKYKDRIKIPEMTEEDFKNNFLVVVTYENARGIDENDLMIYEVVADSTTTHIIMKQKENPKQYNQDNVFYAVVDNSQLRDNADTKVDNNYKIK